MITPPSEVVKAVESGVTRILRRLEFYERDGITPWYPEGTNIDEPQPRLIQGGSVNIDASRDERRTLEVDLDNRDGLMRLNPDGGFWYDKVLKVYRGIRYYDSTGELVDWETQVGEFVIDGIGSANFPHKVHVVARDYTKRMMLSKLANSETFDPATGLDDLLKAFALNSGVVKFNIPNNLPNIGVQLDVARNTDRWSVAKNAANAQGYDIFFDARGVFTVQKMRDPAFGAVEVVFKTGVDGNLASYEKSVNDSELYNHIVVVGNREGEEDALPYFGEAVNTEPSSPTSVDRIGDRVFQYEFSTLTSDEQAQDVAVSFLKIAALESYDMNFQSIAYSWLDAGIVTEILDPDRLDTDPTRYLLSSIEMPLGLGPMSATAKRLTIVGSAT